MGRDAIPTSIVLATVGVVSLLLVASGAVSAERDLGQLSDFTPTVFAYLPVVARETTDTKARRKPEGQASDYSPK